MSRSIKIKRVDLLVSIICILVSPSCKKYLNATPNKDLVTISSVGDLQGLMDNDNYMNILCSEAGDDASDNYFLTDISYAALPLQGGRYAYLWQPGVFDAQAPSDWQNEYTVVYNANVVLDNIGSIIKTSDNAAAWDNCKGQALAFRGKSFLEIAAIWAKAYDSATAASTPGIPLRLTSDFNAPTTRASLAETYKQIIADLSASLTLLPNVPVFVERPSKGAVYGLLARTYLAMRDYKDARAYADSSLQINSKLIDFNSVVTSPIYQFVTYPFAALVYTNPEEVMYTTMTLTNLNLYVDYMRIDTTLYQSYDANDLRKTVYFKKNADGYYYYTGSYVGVFVMFNGIATDEMYLTRAEGAARDGDVAHAIADVNTLLFNRWVTGTFTPFTTISADSALSLILEERRKELVFRSTRWTDIKRLNMEGANISITRNVNGQIYTLPPNDPRFALPIPTNVIQLTGIVQN